MWWIKDLNKLQDNILNKTREIKVDNFNKSKTKSFISDTSSSISRLFPHVTKRKTDNNEATYAYNNIERNSKLPSSFNSIENADIKIAKNSKSNTSLKFVFN